MLNIRPVSDLRNKYPEIEEAVLKSGEPVFLTKNGYGSMVLLSLEQYSRLTDEVETALDEADQAAEHLEVRYSGSEVFSRVRGGEFVNGKHYKLRILPMFENDLNEIVDYITYQLQNPIAAEHLVDAVETAIDERLDCAEAFEIYPSLKERQYPYYRIPVKQYTIFYVVIGDIMEVRRILYSRSDWKRYI